MFCQVAKCRFAGTHVTRGHRCGRCSNYGHGQEECTKQPKIDLLRKYMVDILPVEKRCTIKDCEYSNYHTNDSHHCNICGERHAENQHKPPAVKYRINCPVCKKQNDVYSDQQKVFGISEICCVCLQNTVDTFLTSCGHTVMCMECIKKM